MHKDGSHGSSTPALQKLLSTQHKMNGMDVLLAYKQHYLLQDRGTLMQLKRDLNYLQMSFLYKGICVPGKSLSPSIIERTKMSA